MEIWSKCDICGRDIPVGELCYGLKKGNCICKDCCTGFENCTFTLAPAPTITPPNEWVSVEERLPEYNIREDGELVSSKILCYCETDKTVHLAVSRKFYTARKGEIVHPVFRYYDEWGDEIEDVSHWMPLPAPPTKEE